MTVSPRTRERVPGTAKLQRAGGGRGGDQGEDAGPDCIEAADACLAVSETATAGETYRGAADDATRWSALAAEWAARAAEGLATAAARYWALHAESKPQRSA